MAQSGRQAVIGRQLPPRDVDAGGTEPRLRVRGGRAVSTTLAAAGWTAIALHLLMLAVNQWLIYDQVRLQAPPELRDRVATIFVGGILRTGTGELLALLAAALLAVHLGRQPAFRAGPQLMLSVLLLSYAPIAMHSAGVAMALLGGWDLDVWLVASATARPDDVIATLADALPVILEPLSSGRTAATIGSVLVFALLQSRVCGLPAVRSLGAALAFGGMLMLARLTA